jgi:hypothetical protein
MHCGTKCSRGVDAVETVKRRAPGIFFRPALSKMTARPTHSEVAQWRAGAKRELTAPDKRFRVDEKNPAKFSSASK